MNIEQVLQPESTGEVCPECGEEFKVSVPRAGQVELECPCGCSLAVA